MNHRRESHLQDTERDQESSSEIQLWSNFTVSNLSLSYNIIKTTCLSSQHVFRSHTLSGVGMLMRKVRPAFQHSKADEKFQALYPKKMVHNINKQ